MWGTVCLLLLFHLWGTVVCLLLLFHEDACLYCSCPMECLPTFALNSALISFRYTKNASFVFFFSFSSFWFNYFGVDISLLNSLSLSLSLVWCFSFFSKCFASFQILCFFRDLEISSKIHPTLKYLVARKRDASKVSLTWGSISNQITFSDPNSMLKTIVSSWF